MEEIKKLHINLWKQINFKQSLEMKLNKHLLESDNELQKCMKWNSGVKRSIMIVKKWNYNILKITLLLYIIILIFYVNQVI